jgi:uncharacterized DUF497 family protein
MVRQQSSKRAAKCDKHDITIRSAATKFIYLSVITAATSLFYSEQLRRSAAVDAAFAAISTTNNRKCKRFYVFVAPTARQRCLIAVSMATSIQTLIFVAIPWSPAVRRNISDELAERHFSDLSSEPFQLLLPSTSLPPTIFTSISYVSIVSARNKRLSILE